MSDRIYILRDGKIVGEYKREDFSTDEIAAKMLGYGGGFECKLM